MTQMDQAAVNYMRLVVMYLDGERSRDFVAYIFNLTPDVSQRRV